MSLAQWFISTVSITAPPNRPQTHSLNSPPPPPTPKKMQLAMKVINQSFWDNINWHSIWPESNYYSKNICSGVYLCRMKSTFISHDVVCFGTTRANEHKEIQLESLVIPLLSTFLQCENIIHKSKKFNQWCWLALICSTKMYFVTMFTNQGFTHTHTPLLSHRFPLLSARNDKSKYVWISTLWWCKQVQMYML